MTVVVIGDVGGHAGQLERALASLNVTAGRWPGDLHVIQVGDLLGGVDDVAVVELVEPHLTAGRWTQLLGNWDTRRLGGHDFRPPGGRALPAVAAEECIAGWYSAGLARYAATVTTRSGRSAVVTHAGITRGWWLDSLDAEWDSQRAVEMINASPFEDLHRTGEMLGSPGDARPGPVWASTAEIWSSWLAHPSPWPQIHGHSSAWSYSRRTWAAWTPNECTAFASVERRTRYVTGRGDGPTILGIDNSVYDARNLVLRPLVIPGATTP